VRGICGELQWVEEFGAVDGRQSEEKKEFMPRDGEGEGGRLYRGAEGRVLLSKIEM
jgi:hypothetical protein